MKRVPSTARAMPADEPLRDMATVNRFGKSRPPEKNSSAVGITMSVRLSGTTSDRTSIDSGARIASRKALRTVSRSEEHTSELQSQSNLVCRLLLEKKKKKKNKR